MRWARPTLYWGLPPLILYLIFTRIDLEQLVLVLSNAKPVLISTGIVWIVLLVATGGLRWHNLLHHYGCASLSVAKSIAEYWKSLAVGVLVPGSLGADAYRVMFLGRQSGYYFRSAFVIGVEKLAALFSCAVIVAGLYPFLTPNHLPGVVAHIVDVLYIAFLVGLAVGILLAFVRRHGWARSLNDGINAYLESKARQVASLTSTPQNLEEKSPRTAMSLMLSALSPAVALPSVALSMVILFLSSLQSQLFFQALGYEVPFLINLFIAPLLFLLFSLPISFGGIGLREGAFILLYGAFGVPAEIALAVSFCSFLGVLFSYAIGACLFMLSKHGRSIVEID